MTKTAIVSGGAQGIGLAVSKRLLSDGWAVVVADIDDEACAEVDPALSALGNAIIINADVSDEASVSSIISQAVERFDRLDGVVNNAAITANSPIEDLSRADWDRVLAVNLSAPFLFAKTAAPHLRQTRGAIVNIGSIHATQTTPNREAYAASKAGLRALTTALAFSLAPEIRVNSVSPGLIETAPWHKSSKRSPRFAQRYHDVQPLGRVGLPEDVAAAVAFLLSDEAAFVTAADLQVDGGMGRKLFEC